MPAAQPGVGIREYYRGNVIDLGYAATLTTMLLEVVRGRDGGGTMREFHHIYDDADPNGSTAYDSAPSGSTFTRTTTGTVQLYIKTASSTWTLVGSQS